MNVRIISTKYVHWGNYSGITQLPKYLDKDLISLEFYKASDSDEDFKIANPRIREFLKVYIKKRGMEWYKLSDLVAEYKAFLQIFTGQLDILHYLDAEHSAQFIPLIMKKLRINRTKLIGTFHQPVSVIENLVSSDVIQGLDKITVVSPEQIDYFMQYKSQKDIKLILHGANTDFFKPNERDRDTTKFRCITVGHWQRDFNVISKIVDILANNNQIEFIFVTSRSAFPDHTGLENKSNVRLYRDGISDDKLLELYNESDVLLLPLISSTANNAIIEAISCGVPVISSSLTSVKAYLPGEEAILVEGNDPEKYVDVILDLTKNSAKLKKMSKIARIRAKQLDWQKISLQYFDLYLTLIK